MMILYAYMYRKGFPGGANGKEPTCNAGESPGQRSLVGLRPQDHKELGITEAT